MSPGEVIWRADRAARELLPGSVGGAVDEVRLLAPAQPGGGPSDWDGALDAFRAGRGRPVLMDRDRMAVVARRCPDGTAELLAAADRAVHLRFEFLGYPEVRLPEPVDWHDDPLAGVRWPALPARRINHRTAGADPKWIWELNRLQHLPWLAQAWMLTDDDRYSGAAFEQLDAWIDQNPPGQGIAWRGAFEVGLRAISIALAVQGLRDSPDLTTSRYRRVTELLDASARRCWRGRSRFSSANNHLVGELAGLAVVALLFPELAAAAQWERRALAELAVQADRQILPDGVGAEQAIGYQMFVAELTMLVALLLRIRGSAVPPQILAAIDRSATYLSAMVGDTDPDPRFGDDDEGFAVRLGAEPVRTVRDHLGIVGSFAGHRLARRCGRPTPAAVWFAAPDDDRPSNPDGAPVPQEFFAPHGGIVVLRTPRRRLVMDVGPLGYLSLAAHGHADALSVTVAFDGSDVVTDPGVGSYYGHPDRRAVHRGTRAHATVVVDQVDQSQIGGPFLWTEHARTTVHRVDLARGIVDAEHDGYCRLARPVRHRRWLIAPPDRDEVLVVDLLDGHGQHELRACWPLAPDVDARPAGGGHDLARAGRDLVGLRYGASLPLHCEQVRGDESSGLGWWSQRLESRLPAWWLSAVCTGELPVVMATVIGAIADPDHLPGAPAISYENNEIRVEWAIGTTRRAACIAVSGPDDQGIVVVS
jgi:hypothetical protein